MTLRADIVAEARSWIGTPWHHQARGPKGVGVDCAGLVIAVARTLGLVPPQFDVGGYGLRPDGVSLVATCDEHMVRIGQADMQPGDVLVVAFAQDPQHVGILTDHAHGGLGLCHALNRTSAAVVETRLEFTRAMRFIAAYRLPGVA